MVYVVQETKHNVWVAASFGTLKAVFPASQRFFGTPSVAEARRILGAFSDDDFLLLVGDPVAIGIATSIAAAANGGKYKVLVWTGGDYVPAQVDLNGEH